MEGSGEYLARTRTNRLGSGNLPICVQPGLLSASGYGEMHGLTSCRADHFRVFSLVARFGPAFDESSIQVGA